MPECKYCHESLTRFNKDVCPYCGGKKPLEGVDSSTIDITKVLDPVSSNEAETPIKFKRRLVAGLLTIFFGLFGANFFYLGHIKTGLIALAISFLLIGGVGSLLCFVTTLTPIWSYLIPALALETIYIVLGFIYFFKQGLKDAKGVFLR